MHQRIIFKGAEPRVLLSSDKHSDWKRDRLWWVLHVPVKDTAAKIAAAAGAQAKWGFRLLEEACCRVWWTSSHVKNSVLLKGSSLGIQLCCKCFGSLIGTITDAFLTAALLFSQAAWLHQCKHIDPSVYHPSSPAWEPRDGGFCQPKPKGFAGGCSDAIARSAGVLCLVDHVPPGS